MSNSQVNELRNQLKRHKKQRMRSSTSAFSSKMSNEFYLGYFKVLKTIKNPNLKSTIEPKEASPAFRKRSKSNKRRRPKGLRPKSAPGTRIFSKVAKARRGTIDAERLNASRHNNLVRGCLDLKKSVIKNRKSFSPLRNKRKFKPKKRRSAKKQQKSKTSEERHTLGPGILNFKFNNQNEIFSPKITLYEAQAAFKIFFHWKVSKLMKAYGEEGVFLPNYTLRHTLDAADFQDVEERKSDLEIYDQYKNCLIDQDEDLKNSSRGQESEEDLETPKTQQDPQPEPDSYKNTQEFNTVLKAKQPSNPSEPPDEGEESEMTKIYIRSSREEMKGQPGVQDDGKEGSKTPVNPFEFTQDILDTKEKVVHLSTINTNENVENNSVLPSINEEEALKALQDLAGSGSLVEVISHKDGSGSARDCERSDTKRNLFHGRDSLLRDVISHTPRSFQAHSKEDTTNPQYFNGDNKEEDNSEAATRKFRSTTNSKSSSPSHPFHNLSFQRFSHLQLNNMIDTNDFGVLLQLREKAVRYREKTERKIIQKMCNTGGYSDREVKRRTVELEKWVSEEKKEIKMTKEQLLQKWNQTKDMLEQTEENAQILKNQIGSID